MLARRPVVGAMTGFVVVILVLRSGLRGAVPGVGGMLVRRARVVMLLGLRRQAAGEPRSLILILRTSMSMRMRVGGAPADTQAPNGEEEPGRSTEHRVSDRAAPRPSSSDGPSSEVPASGLVEHGPRLPGRGARSQVYQARGWRGFEGAPYEVA